MNSRTIRVFGLLFLLAALLLGTLSIGPVTAQGPDGGDGDVSTGTTNPTTMLYQGYVTVGSIPYDGTGYFKFAIVNAAGNTTYWSNDGTSSGGDQPTAAVSSAVSHGYFTVLLGDTSISGMTQALNPTVFAEAGRHLRVWFATAATGPFTQLSLVPIAAAPYALNAETLDGLDSNALARSDHDHWGASWSGSGQGLALAGANSAGSTLVVTNTLYDAIGGYSLSGDWAAGVFGVSWSASHGMGVQGVAVITTGEAYGVWGKSYAPGGAGVYGEGITAVGGYFTSGDGSGVYASSTNGSGVEAHSSSSWASAVYGENTSSGAGGYFTSVDGYGVYGTSQDLDGVRGISTGGDYADNGVYGETNSTYTGEAGVYGYSSRAAAGVYGLSVYGTGVSAASMEGGTGINGWTHWNYTSTNAIGVKGWTRFGYGVYGTTWDGKGVYGEAWNRDGGTFRSWYGGKGIYAESSWGYGAYISNTLYVNGNMIVTGGKSGYVVDIAINADEVALQSGDVVAVVGFSEPIVGEIPVMQVRRATSAVPTAVVGVVDQLFVHDGKPEVMSPECIKQREAFEQAALQPAATPEPQPENDRALPGPVGTPPPPRDCRVTEKFVAGVDGIQPGQYLSIVTLGAYKAIKVDASYGAIQPGDLLVASPNPGYAMKATNPQPGTIIGKALALWTSGTGVIPVLVTLQ